MGIQVEYNPDLALRSFEEFKVGRRQREECLPEKMQAGKVFDFLKSGQRLYWLHGELPLLETKGNQNLSSPIAGIIILEVTHVLIKGEVWIKGKYKITEVFEDKKVHFNGFAKVK
jgi:hypothetical protein